MCRPLQPAFYTRSLEQVWALIDFTAYKDILDNCALSSLWQQLRLWVLWSGVHILSTTYIQYALFIIDVEFFRTSTLEVNKTKKKQKAKMHLEHFRRHTKPCVLFCPLCEKKLIFTSHCSNGKQKAPSQTASQNTSHRISNFNCCF